MRKRFSTFPALWRTTATEENNIASHGARSQQAAALFPPPIRSAAAPFVPRKGSRCERQPAACPLAQQHAAPWLRTGFACQRAGYAFRLPKKHARLEARFPLYYISAPSACQRPSSKTSPIVEMAATFMNWFVQSPAGRRFPGRHSRRFHARHGDEAHAVARKHPRKFPGAVHTIQLRAADYGGMAAHEVRMKIAVGKCGAAGGGQIRAVEPRGVYRLGLNLRWPLGKLTGNARGGVLRHAAENGGF